MTWDSVFVWLGWVLIAAGFIGCLLPVIPGPPIAYAALFLALARGDHSSPSIACLIAAGAATAIAVILDFVVPMMGAKKFNCSRAGTVGCFIGTIAGLFFLPVGLIAGPFLGALAGELVSQKPIDRSLKGAFGALLGFVCGVFLKLACCAFLAYCYWQTVSPQ